MKNNKTNSNPPHYRSACDCKFCQPASPEQPAGRQGEAWRACYGAIIKSLAAMARVGAPDSWPEDAIRRDPIMEEVRRIRQALDTFNKAKPFPNPAAPVGVPDDDARDAALWRGLIGSARIRSLGSAGLHGEVSPYGTPWNGYAHIGLELWTKYDHANDQSEAIRTLTRYAEIAADQPSNSPTTGAIGENGNG